MSAIVINPNHYPTDIIKRIVKTVRLLFILSFFAFYQGSFTYLKAQTIDANLFTGSATSSIPIYNIQQGSISVPISLQYNSSGIRVKETERNAGMGWSVTGGGTISRELRDLPDEVNSGTGADSRKGWIHSGYANKIQNFTIGNDNNVTTCPDETSDLSYLSTNFPNLWDLEPDLFHVNAPGLSTTLMFDVNNNLVSLDDLDLKIQHTMSTSGYGLEKFTITNGAGLVYQFDQATRNTKKTTSLNPSAISYLKREYELFKNSISFNNGWSLSKITDPNGNIVSFQYEQNSITTSRDVSFYVGTSTTKTLQYKIEESSNQKHIKEIMIDRKPDNLGVLSVNFSYRKNSSTNTNLIEQIVVYTMESELIFAEPHLQPKSIIKRCFFNYAIAKSNNSSTSDYYRYFLVNFTDGGQKIIFDYHGLSETSTSSYSSNHTINLPDSSSKSLDTWGFYNGAVNTTLRPAVYINPSSDLHDRLRHDLPSSVSSFYPYSITGASRSPHAENVKMGMLTRITLNNGGFSEVSYEPNQYHDPQAGITLNGGGVRVAQLRISDGENPNNDQLRTIEYIDPVSGKSSGAPISLPLMAFVQPYTGSGTTETLWRNSIVASDEGLSPEIEHIQYNHVRVRINGNGNTLYSYNRPAMYYDGSSAPDWQPTRNFVARSNCSTIGFPVGGNNIFPFSPNKNFSFERGFLLSETVFNQGGQKVLEKKNSYIRSSSPVLQYGLKMEQIGTATYYGKYPILIGQGKQFVRQSVLSYDNSSGVFQDSTAIQYVYGSPFHRLPTEVISYGSDGTRKSTSSKYVKDYVFSTVNDGSSIALKEMAALNINAPVETYRTIERSGVKKTVSAELLTFKTFLISGITRYLPAQKLIFQEPAGVINFQTSSITAGAFKNDSRYWTSENYTDYNSKGLLRSSDNNKGGRVSTLYSGYLSYAEAQGASVNEIAVNTFEDALTDYENGLQVEAPTLPYEFVRGPEVRSGWAMLKTVPNLVLFKNFIKNIDVQNYVISFWVKSTSSGSFTVTTSAASVAAQNTSINYVNTGNVWKMYQQVISVSHLPADFTIKVKSLQEVLLDDIQVYPQGAVLTVGTLNYDLGIKTSQTNINGQSQFFNYDGYGRLVSVKDHNKDIVMTQQYVNKNDEMTVGISHDGIAVNKAITFNATGFVSQNQGVKYLWNFGDGSSAVATSAENIQHSYSTTGTFTVSVNKTSPLYGSISSTKTIQVTPYDSTVSVQVLIGEQSGGTITKVEFYKGTQLKYLFTGNELNWNSPYKSVRQDYYTIRVYATGGYEPRYSPQGFKSVGFSLSNGEEVCQPIQNGYFEFSSNLAGQNWIHFFLKLQECLPIFIE
ncbi:PKD domain-containing protein [Sphingobacterium faecium]|uniref:PKD domain-containing protein n=1 Tax=Sphingobacterium faecium TaxID=34087 RepID=UPI0032079405